MATWDGSAWNALRALVTTQGVYTSVYRPGSAGELVDILGPDGAHHTAHTPALADWCLAAEDGAISIYYSRIVDGGHDLVRVPTGIGCGQAAGATTTGGTGPVGPAGAPGPAGDRGQDGKQGPAGAPGKDAQVTQEVIDAIAAAVVNRVFSEPPAPDHFGLPPGAQSGTKFQDMQTIMLINQAVLQEIIKGLDQAVVNLKADGYTPKGA